MKNNQKTFNQKTLKKKSMKGGIKTKISNIDFKYTLSKERKTWVKNVYSSMNILTSIISDIPWNTYQFNNNAIITIAGFEDDETATIISEHGINVKSNINGIKYTFLGGICYELLSDYYKNVEMSWFIDPTGDIDINIVVPFIEKNEEIKKIVTDNAKLYPSYAYISAKFKLMNADNVINPYYKNIIDWILLEMKNRLIQLDLNKLFPNSVEFDISEYEDIPTKNKIESMGFNDIIIGNIHLISYISNTSNDELIENFEGRLNDIRIQIIVKIVENNISKIDHLLEMIIPCNPNIIPDVPTFKKEKVFNNFILDINDKTYSIDNLDKLADDNIIAYNSRLEFIQNMDKNNIHKTLNHIGRLLYLYELAKNNLNNPQILSSVENMNLFTILNMNKILTKEKQNNLTKMIPANTLKTELTTYKKTYDTQTSEYSRNNASFKFYKLISNNDFVIYDIKIMDFIQAYIDVFSIYRNPFPTIFNINKIEHMSKSPYENEYHTKLIHFIKSNAARPSLRYITKSIKKKPKSKSKSIDSKYI